MNITNEMILHAVLTNDEDGNSYFQDRSEPLEPSTVGFTSAPLSSEHIFFGKASEVQDWHTAPQRLFIIVLSGTMQVESSVGEVRNFLPGQVVLFEDLKGKGHRTCSLDGEPVEYLAIPH